MIMPKMLFDIPEKTGDSPENHAAPLSSETDISGDPENASLSPLAMGLPADWSIEPPSVVVRRKARVL
jgi:hypothetical protein